LFAVLRFVFGFARRDGAREIFFGIGGLACSRKGA